jgi:hypothetical protein
MKRVVNMAGYTCPFCQHDMSLNEGSFSERYPSFDRECGVTYGPNFKEYFDESTLKINFYKCPHCEKYSIIVNGKGSQTEAILSYVQPKSFAKQFPEYIPQLIRDDYTEACAIVNLSPKASATLSRRCLQGMIRDFWKIEKATLFEEIKELQKNIPVAQWKVIDGVRRIGNIGAHMEKDINLIVDIEPDEAQKLIKLIESLINDWYIQRFEQEQLYTDIIGIDADKQILKNPKE